MERAAIAIGFVVVFVLRQAYGDVDDGLSVLYVIPISIAAVRYGFAAGLAAAALAFVLVVVWVLIDDVDMSALGYVTRGSAFIVAGGAIGLLEQRTRGAQARRQALAVHDQVVQRLTIARYQLQAGREEKALEALDSALEGARNLVMDELDEDTGPGDLRLP